MITVFSVVIVNTSSGKSNQIESTSYLTYYRQQLKDIAITCYLGNHVI